MLAKSTSSPDRPFRTLDTPHGPLVFGGRCLVMGVLNVTPDSFSDAGQCLDHAAAEARGVALAADGADVIDIGGESSRPGSQPVPAAVQIGRVVPVVRRLRQAGVSLPISIDTWLAQVAAAALDAGADLVNDITGVRADRAMPRLLAERGVPFVVMHMQGTPATMQNAPHYQDVVVEVGAFFDERAAALAAEGVDVGRMIVDPGVGFGKTLEHNLALLRAASSFGTGASGLGQRVPSRRPVLVGPSRKRFLGELLSEPNPAQRLGGTAAAVAYCALCGVDMVRVHDVKAMRQVTEVCHRLGANSA